VALGLAIGVFFGALPCMGIQTVIALPFAFALNANKIAAMIGVWWTNPITAIPVYYASYIIGRTLSSRPSISYREFFAKIRHVSDIPSLLELGRDDLLLPLLWGGLIMGIILFPVSYFSFKWMLEKRHERKLRKKEIRARKRREKELKQRASVGQK
jgi:uncharacterized protein (DUF2062 family)